MSKRKKKQPPKLGPFKRPDTNPDQEPTVLPVSEFVRDFVRRHVAPSQRAQSDLSWVAGASNVSYNLNLLPQSTHIIRPNQTKRAKANLPMRFKHSKQRPILTIACSKPFTVPSNLPNQLHNLWIGYASSAMKWCRLNCMASIRPLANSSQTTQLESVLRLNLIGAKLKIIRSTASCLAGRQGIVLMETKTLFRMALDCDTRPKSSNITLYHVPKAGSLFLLYPPRCLGDKNSWDSNEFAILLNGDRLTQRVVDRATRKWRAPLPAVGQTLPSVDELMGDLLCEQCC